MFFLSITKNEHWIYYIVDDFLLVLGIEILGHPTTIQNQTIIICDNHVLFLNKKRIYSTHMKSVLPSEAL